jgi:hypothetical protein
MSKVKLSLKPLSTALWEKHEPSGAEFLIAPLPGEVDQDLTHQAMDFAGQIDMHAFGQLVAPEIIQDWRGVGDRDGAQPCNPENIKIFVRHHCLTVLPWIIRRARSLDYYREQEVTAAKNA